VFQKSIDGRLAPSSSELTELNKFANGFERPFPDTVLVGSRPEDIRYYPSMRYLLVGHVPDQLTVVRCDPICVELLIRKHVESSLEKIELEILLKKDQL
jgi:hypothetical protein